MLGCHYFARPGFIPQNGSLNGGRGRPEQKVGGSLRQKRCRGSSPGVLLVTAVRRSKPFAMQPLNKNSSGSDLSTNLIWCSFYKERSDRSMLRNDWNILTDKQGLQKTAGGS